MKFAATCICCLALLRFPVFQLALAQGSISGPEFSPSPASPQSPLSTSSPTPSPNKSPSDDDDDDDDDDDQVTPATSSGGVMPNAIESGNPSSGNTQLIGAVVGSVVSVLVIAAGIVIFIIVRKRKQQSLLATTQVPGSSKHLAPVPSFGKPENGNGNAATLGGYTTTDPSSVKISVIPNATDVTSCSEWTMATEFEGTRVISPETTVLEGTETTGIYASQQAGAANVRAPGNNYNNRGAVVISKLSEELTVPSTAAVMPPIAGITATPSVAPSNLSSSSEDLMLKWSDLKMGKKIGTGGFGEVWRATWQGHPVAVKMMLKCSPKELQDLRHEADIMSKCYNPNIARVYGIADDGHQRVALVMQYYRGGSLSSLIADVKYDDLDILARLDIALQVARGMRYMHERPRPILHLDLKTSNILLEESASKWVHLDRPRLIACIADFGLSGKTTESGGVEATAATPTITPPEVFLNKNAPRMPSADVYAFGILLLEILTGTRAWGKLNLLQLRTAAVSGVRPKIPDSVPADLADMIQACWAHDPASRPAFGEVSEKLEIAARLCIVAHSGHRGLGGKPHNGDDNNDTMMTNTMLM